METKQLLTKPYGRPFHRAVTFGRFNLLHKGHLALFKEMGRMADYVTIGLSDNPKNLPFELRKEVIKIALADSGIAYSMTMASNPFELFQHVHGLNNPNVCTVFGEDQLALGIAAKRHYGWLDAHVERLTSSTALRAHLDLEEWDVLASLTVPGTIPHLINLRKLELTRSNA